MCTKMNGFKFDFYNTKLWGWAHRAPSPDLTPDFSWALFSVRASPSIHGHYALSIRGFTLNQTGPQLSNEDPGLRFAPLKKILDPSSNYLLPVMTSNRYLASPNYTYEICDSQTGRHDHVNFMK